MIERCAPTLLDTFQILERVRDFLLLDVSLSSRKLEEVLRTASHEKQRSGRGRDERGEDRARRCRRGSERWGESGWRA